MGCAQVDSFFVSYHFEGEKRRLSATGKPLRASMKFLNVHCGMKVGLVLREERGVAITSSNSCAAVSSSHDWPQREAALSRYCSVRAEYNLVRERPRLLLRCSEPRRAAWLREHGDTTIVVLATAESTQVITPADASGRKNCATAVVDDTTAVMMELSGGLLEKELKRLQEREVRTLRQHIAESFVCHLRGDCVARVLRLQASLSTQRAALEKRMSAVGYDKAGDQVKGIDEEKASRLDGELQTVLAALQNLSS